MSAPARALSPRTTQLPIEIIADIGKHLLPPSGVWSYSDGSRHGFSALLALSSLCRYYRWELTPMLWTEITLFDTSHMRRFMAQVAPYYAKSSKHTATLRCFFPYIRSLRINDCVDLGLLIRFLRLQSPIRIESLSWRSSEGHRPCQECKKDGDICSTSYKIKLWPLLLPSLRQLDLGFLPRTLLGLVCLAGGLESLRYSSPDDEAILLLSDFTTTHRRLARIDVCPKQWILALAALHCTTSKPKSGLKRLSMMDRSGSALWPRMIDSFGQRFGPSSLEEIEISSNRSNLVLVRSLLAHSSGLRRLAIKFDTNGPDFFRAFDRFFVILSAPSCEEPVFPRLTSVHIEPLPQQNTAPSFFSFIEKCPSLEEINGRKKGTFPPCLGLFSPDTSSGALPY